MLISTCRSSAGLSFRCASRMAAGGAARVSRGGARAGSGRGFKIHRGSWVCRGTGDKEPGRSRSLPRGGEGPSRDRLRGEGGVLEKIDLELSGACGVGARELGRVLRRGE